MLFSAVDSENSITDADVMVIKLESGGLYIYATSVTLTATTCSSNTAYSETFSVGAELGMTQIQITLAGDQVAVLVTILHDRSCSNYDMKTKSKMQKSNSSVSH